MLPTIELSDDDRSPQKNVSTQSEISMTPKKIDQKSTEHSMTKDGKPNLKNRTKIEESKKGFEQMPKMERKRRAAAENAIQNIQKGIKDETNVIDASDDGVESSGATPPKKRRLGAKTTTIQATSTTKTEESVNDYYEKFGFTNRFAPQNVPKSHRDRINRMLENCMKLSKTAEEEDNESSLNPNANFSYRSYSKNTPKSNVSGSFDVSERCFFPFLEIFRINLLLLLFVVFFRKPKNGALFSTAMPIDAHAFELREWFNEM